jgi:plasmid stabilization system protein ParE
VKVLGHQPQIGRPIEEMTEAYREWQIDFGDSYYRVRYRVAPNAVIILAVRYQKEAGHLRNFRRFRLATMRKSINAVDTLPKH